MDLINEKIDLIIKKTLHHYLNENLYTHDDDYNLLGKLYELDIDYDYINSNDTAVSINTPDDNTRKKVFELLNYYGWKAIKDLGWCICAERIYGDLWNNFYDSEAENDQEEGNSYPYGVGIYYHITTSNKVNKILKQGLTVREGNKLGYSRGARTYLISYPNEELAYSLFKDMKDSVDVTILLVDLREFLGKQINIYHDDFTSDDGAVYTYDYIPPKCLKVYKTFTIKR